MPMSMNDELTSVSKRVAFVADSANFPSWQRDLARTTLGATLKELNEQIASGLTVAIFSAVGIGKTALISNLSGLRREVKSENPRDWSVLTVGQGRTTLGTVKIFFHDHMDYKVEVIPWSRDDIEIEIGLMAKDEYLKMKGQPGISIVDHSENNELRKLIERWLSDFQDSRPATLLDALEKAPSLEQFQRTFIDKCLDPACRLSPFQQTFPPNEASLGNMQALLNDIMKGSPNTPVPRETRIFLPRDGRLKRFDCIVDTQGFDSGPMETQLRSRDDWREHIQQPNTVLLIASRFENAPDSETRALLKDLRSRSTRLLGVHIVLLDKSPFGADETERQQKEAECQKILNIPKNHITTINVVKDPPATLALAQNIRIFAQAELEKFISKELSEIQVALEECEVSETELYVRRAGFQLWTLADSIRAEVENANPFTEMANHLFQTVLSKNHWSQLYASVRRRGRYGGPSTSHALV
jgi:energy-coupling factor transporter ATP-binding protein EcfA2